MTITIMKFGGSCFKNEEAFNRIFKITKFYDNSKKIYVASAFSGITDLLLNAVNSLKNDKNKRIQTILSQIEKIHKDTIERIFDKEVIYYHKAKDWVDLKLNELTNLFAEINEFGLEAYYIDYVSSFGEILSTFILNEYLQSKGLESIFLSATEIIITDDNFNNAYPLYHLINNRIQKKIIPILESNKRDTIFCITGFIGRNKIGNITTLGRGGSDYTATILAHSLYAVGNDKDIKVILWKDVDGILAINPKYISDSVLIRKINYLEAKQIANFGAKVLHPKCLEALEKNKIPLEIRNFENPLEKLNYTLISKITDGESIKGISAVEDATIITITSGSMVDIPGVLAKIFKILGENNISISLVSQSASEICTSLIVKQEDHLKAVEALKGNHYFTEFFEIKSEDVAIINVTGSKIFENRMKINIFKALEKNKIIVRAISQSFDELNISIVVNKKELTQAINLIYNYIYLDLKK